MVYCLGLEGSVVLGEVNWLSWMNTPSRKHGSKPYYCMRPLPSSYFVYRWVLGVSPAGTCNVLEALRLIFESGNHVDAEEQGRLEKRSSEQVRPTACMLSLLAVGIYLVVSAMPDQEVVSHVRCGETLIFQADD